MVSSRMRLCIYCIILGTIIVISTVGLRGSSSPAPESVEAADTGFTKLTGTIKATYHLSHTEYVQTYDAVTTASLEWEEDPDIFFGCPSNCRPFFPTGSIEWSYDYHVVYNETEECTDMTGGTVAAGVGPLGTPFEQMLILWDDLSDEDQYIYSGIGAVPGSSVINCDGGFTVSPIAFWSLPGPDEVSTNTPTLPPTQPPGAPLAAQVAGVPLCSEAAPFKQFRISETIKGSCYDSYSEDESSLEYLLYEWDLAVPKEPIIFIHGIMGSQIMCGGEELWPNVRVRAGIPPYTYPQFRRMALAADGISRAPAPDACAATVGELIRKVLIKDVYGKTIDFLNQVAPGRAYFFNWDWRKSPEESLNLLGQFIEEKRALHDNQKVVIMAHSYGGLLARLYVNDAARAGNVARVVTIGTPAWGAASALFPLYAGIKAPGDAMNLIFKPREDVYELAKNLAGNYFLYPSQAYGPWLFTPSSPAPLSVADLINYVISLGGNPALLGRALSVHATALDFPYLPGPGDPKFEVIVGTKLPTITAIHILDDKHVQVDYETGDGTVPGESGARGQTNPGNPNRDRTHYVCGVDHVSLPGNSMVTDAIKDFLRFGDKIEGPGIKTTACSLSGRQFEVFRARRISASGIAGGVEPTSTPQPGGPISIDDADMQGLVDYFDLPYQKLIISSGEIPEIALPEGSFLAVTPLEEAFPGGKGPPTLYGPLAGETTVSVGAGGTVVLVDGEPAPLHGDMNCDRQVTAADTLLILLYAGGAPRPPAAGCATIGTGTEPFGDMDCSDSVATSDVLANLQIASGAPLDFLAGCY